MLYIVILICTFNHLEVKDQNDLNDSSSKITITILFNLHCGDVSHFLFWGGKLFALTGYH